jgi:hypothetical protein
MVNVGYADERFFRRRFCRFTDLSPRARGSNTAATLKMATMVPERTGLEGMYLAPDEVRG